MLNHACCIRISDYRIFFEFLSNAASVFVVVFIIVVTPVVIVVVFIIVVTPVVIVVVVTFVFDKT